MFLLVYFFYIVPKKEKPYYFNDIFSKSLPKHMNEERLRYLILSNQEGSSNLIECSLGPDHLLTNTDRDLLLLIESYTEKMF